MLSTNYVKPIPKYILEKSRAKIKNPATYMQASNAFIPILQRGKKNSLKSPLP